MAAKAFKLMSVLAHPDDESLGMGSTLAKYAAEGVETYLLTATRGERGWQGPAEEYPGPEALGRIRTGELLAAARCLGLRRVDFLGYTDGELDQADQGQVTLRIVTHIRRIRPQVLVTFGPDGSYGHPDHIAISQLTMAAAVCAADSAYVDQEAQPAHRVAKLYYMVDSEADVAAWQALVGDISIRVDDVERRWVGWADWAVTAKIDGDAHWRAAWEAIACHQSQLVSYPDMLRLVQEHHRALLGTRSFYRAFSTVNGGRKPETDLFEGLRALE